MMFFPIRYGALPKYMELDLLIHHDKYDVFPDQKWRIAKINGTRSTVQIHHESRRSGVIEKGLFVTSSALKVLF
jgi:hypothetical protein